MMVSPQASRYEAFLKSIFTSTTVAEPGPNERWCDNLSELDLQSLWFAGEFGSHFITVSGKSVVIKDFGVWNHASGPDFVQTAIELEDRTLKGAIEIDPDVRDWERHGHGANPAYDHVILHVYTKAPEPLVFTRNSSHQEVQQVRLTEDMLNPHASAKRQAEARLGRCAEPFARMNDEAVHALLEAAAQYRLQRKSERIHALIRIHGWDQAIYQMLANALGYRMNQRAFTILAQRLPLKYLNQQPKEEREALLFGLSTFLESIRHEDTTPETRSYLRHLWSTWWKRRHAFETWLESHQAPPWSRAGTRPGNHPERRLGALTALLQEWKAVTALLRDPAVWNKKKFGERLLSLEHPYWSHHYTLLSEPVKNPVALLGKTRVHEILANIIYPLLVPANAELWKEYMTLTAVLDNQKVRRASLRLFGEGARAKSHQKYLYQQQGLLQIYEDYCLQDDSACKECHFPEQILKWQ